MPGAKPAQISGGRLQIAEFKLQAAERAVVQPPDEGSFDIACAMVSASCAEARGSPLCPVRFSLVSWPRCDIATTARKNAVIVLFARVFGLTLSFGPDTSVYGLRTHLDSQAEEQAVP